MGAFDRIFNISASRHADAMERNTLDIVSEYNPPAGAAVRAIKADLDRRNIRLDLTEGPMGGSMSFIFRCESCSAAVVRIGDHDDPPASALVLAAAARLDYGAGEFQYQVHVLPNAPDAGEIELHDIVNSVRVLKAEGLEKNLFDLTMNPFVFLRGAGGALLRYPETSADAAMRGRPIAFIRDLNALYRDDLADQAAGMIPAAIYLAERGIDLSALTPAPADCVAACRQQDVIMRQLRTAMLAGGAKLALAA